MLRSFLNSVKSGGDSQAQQNKQALLLQLFQAHPPPNRGAESSAFSGLIQSWHFAVQANSEALCSYIAATFALLLRLISSILEFRGYGTSLCRELLHDDNVKLFTRSLIAHTAKEHLIDPCLRLLTEIVQFDGGSVAKIIYRQKDTTFHRLDVFLSHRKDQRDEGDRERRRPSLRESALHYLLANLRLQGPAVKSYLLSNTRVARSFLSNIVQDPSWMVQKVLAVLRNHIMEDAALAQSTKNRFLSEGVLISLASLYNRTESIETDHYSSVRESVHSFLLFTCVPSYQARLGNAATQQSSEITASDNNRDGDTAELAKLSPRVAKLLPNLKPHADILQGDLILEVFRADPSSVEEYFSRKSNFAFDPRLSATWVGYARFILATIQLPIQKTLLHGDLLRPGLLTSLYHTVLPQPLTQKVLTRCLNQSSQLVTFLTTSILNAAFDKLKAIMHMLDVEQAGKRTIDLKRDLVVELAARCPEMRHVIAQFRSCSEENTTLKESILRLLAAYYQTIPNAALAETFDISTTLSDTLDTYEQDPAKRKGASLKVLELDYLLYIALQSPNMDWWHTSKASGSANKLTRTQLSPFTTLLRAYAGQEDFKNSHQIGQILNTIARENAFLISTNCTNALDILCLSIGHVDNPDHGEIYAYLDNCIQRLVQRPVVYLELSDKLLHHITNGAPKGSVDLLSIALVEQWPHLSQSKPSYIITDVGIWLSKYMSNTELANGNHSVSAALRAQLAALSPNAKYRAIFEDEQQQHIDPNLKEALLAKSPPKKIIQSRGPTDSAEAGEKGLDHMSIPPGPPQEPEDHPELYRWHREDIQDALIDGLLGSLVLCLCSKDQSIRQEALSQLRSLLKKLEVGQPFLQAGFNLLGTGIRV